MCLEKKKIKFSLFLKSRIIFFRNENSEKGIFYCDMCKKTYKSIKMKWYIYLLISLIYCLIAVGTIKLIKFPNIGVLIIFSIIIAVFGGNFVEWIFTDFYESCHKWRLWTGWRLVSAGTCFLWHEKINRQPKTCQNRRVSNWQK